ncbi:hypothetical protein Tco_0032711 [Tanacetum coccineum]
MSVSCSESSLGNIFIPDSQLMKTLISSQSLSKHSNLEVGQNKVIDHRRKIGAPQGEVLGLKVSLMELNRFEILLDEREEGQAWQVTVTGSRLLPVSAFLTQGTVSSISIIFSWGDSISPEGFLSSVLLWLVIIVAVVVLRCTGKHCSVLLNYADETNSAFRTFEVDRLAAHELFVATLSCHRSFSWSGGIISICHVSGLCFQSGGNTISNPEASQSNLVVISHLLSLKFSNSSMSLLEFSFQIVEILLYNHPTFSETFYFVFYVLNAVEREFIQVIQDFLNLLLVTFQTCLTRAFSHLKFLSWDIRPEKRDIVLEVGEKASFIIGSRMVWESRHFTI